MEFNEKLQKLRKQKGMTQEELAAMLYVSRTAVSKWESGRGYPSIESLKAIAKLFSVSLDELLSADEALDLAENEGKRKAGAVRDLLYGILDISVGLLMFLPLFADRVDNDIISTSLLGLENLQPYLIALYFVFVIGSVLCGVVTLAMQNCQAMFWLRGKYYLSLGLSGIGTMLLILSLQPYAAVFVFVILTIKALLLLKR